VTVWRCSPFLEGKRGEIAARDDDGCARWQCVSAIVARECARRVAELGMELVAVSSEIGHSFHPSVGFAVGRGPF
jgi:hypothetical protein